MKPKFSLRLQMKRPVRANNKAEGEVARKFTNATDEQLAEAVQYCLDHNVRGHKALRTGSFPLIKDRETIGCKNQNRLQNFLYHFSTVHTHIIN